MYVLYSYRRCLLIYRFNRILKVCQSLLEAIVQHLGVWDKKSCADEQQIQVYLISGAWKTHWHTNIWIAAFQQNKLQEWLLTTTEKWTDSFHYWKVQLLKQTLLPPLLLPNINHICLDIQSMDCSRAEPSRQAKKALWVDTPNPTLRVSGPSCSLQHLLPIPKSPKQRASQWEGESLICEPVLKQEALQRYNFEKGRKTELREALQISAQRTKDLKAGRPGINRRETAGFTREQLVL